MTKTKALALAFLAVLLMAFPAVVMGQSPPRPVVYAGKVTLDGNLVRAGTQIVAIIDGQPAASEFTKADGGYALRIPQPHGANFTGKEITFRVGLHDAQTKEVWQPGGGGELNIVAVSAPPTPVPTATPPPPPPSPTAPPVPPDADCRRRAAGRQGRSGRQRRQG